jgi:hypothetical protein
LAIPTLRIATDHAYGESCHEVAIAAVTTIPAKVSSASKKAR